MTLSDTNCSLKERRTTDDMSTVSAGVRLILPFLTRSFQEFEKKSCSSKTFEFFQTNYHLNEGFPHVFTAYLILSECNSSVKIISISVDNGFSPPRYYNRLCPEGWTGAGPVEKKRSCLFCLINRRYLSLTDLFDDKNRD